MTWVDKKVFRNQIYNVNSAIRIMMRS